MDLIISLTNATTYTPYLSAVQLTGADWAHTQELRVGDSIAGGRQLVGMVTGGVPFSGSLTVHYTFVTPGPGGADVVLDFEVVDLAGQPSVGFNEQVRPATALAQTTSGLGRLDGVNVVLLHIEE